MQRLRVELCVVALLTVCVHSTPLAAATLRVPQDHNTIQAAIDASSPGDVVIVSAGTYRERLTLQPGITLRSDGNDDKGKLGLKRAEATIIDGTGGSEDTPGVAMAEDSTIDGFTVTGVGTYDEQAWQKHHATQGEDQSYQFIGKPGIAGISVIGVPRCTVVNNIVHHIGYTGIAIMGAKDKRVSPHIVRNVTYRNMGGGIGSMMGSSAIVEANICFENFYAGIGHANASPLVIDNICYDNIRAGIGISEGSKPIVRGNKCYGNRRGGIGVRTGEETTPLIEHNECYDNDMAGIGAREDAAPIIRHNRCYKNGAAGIGCRTGATPLIELNECFENAMAGIGCRSEAAPVIRNNRCYRNEMSGIGSQDKARPVIVGNHCFENVMAGIGTEVEAEAIIRGNTCYANLMAGIGARLGARPIIDGNHCYENLLAGIGSEDDAEPLIRGNRCEKNDQAGIGIQKGTRALIVDNECRENKLAGIGVREQATGLLIDNRCAENKMVAIGVRNASHARIIGNTLSRTGGMPPMIAIREDSSAVVADNTITGGGVAGVMVQGTATVTGNRFAGNGPRRGPGPPNFAAWIHGGSKVSFVGNQIDRWRHALFASEAQSIRVIDNTTKHFLGTAIVVDKSTRPAHVFGNVAISENDADQPARVAGPQGIVADNIRQAPQSRVTNDSPPRATDN